MAVPRHVDYALPYCRPGDRHHVFERKVDTGDSFAPFQPEADRCRCGALALADRSEFFRLGPLPCSTGSAPVCVRAQARFRAALQGSE